MSPSPTTAPAAAKDIMSAQEQFQNEIKTQPLQKISIQFKLAIGSADDPLEHEADVMADAVMRMPEQNYIQRKCKHCEEEEKLQRKPLASFIQRKESSAGTIASDNVSDKIGATKGNGSNMDSQTQSFMQSRFGADFSDVKIHTDSESIQMNRELNAKAFTVGSDIYFNQGQYAPNSFLGKELLAHELTHIVQQGAASSSVVQRTPDTPAAQTSVPTASMQVTLSGFRFQPQGGARYEESELERRQRRIMAIILRRLLGDQFSPTVADRIYELYLARNYSFTGKYELARPTDQMVEIKLSTEASNVLLEIIENDLQLHPLITPEQRELLALGLSSQIAFHQLKDELPNWYTQFIFDREMAQQGDLIRAYNASRLNTPADSEEQQQGLSQIINAIRPAAQIIDLLRQDFHLGNLQFQRSENQRERERLEGISSVYRVLWNLRSNPPQPLTTSPPDKIVNEGVVVILSAFIKTQLSLFEQASDSQEARRELIERFSRFYISRVLSGSTSDEAIMRHPGRANASAWRATLRSTPVLRPPLFDAALETDHRFSMALEFGDVFDAFVSYSYLWERIKIPEPRQGDNRPVDLDLLAGERPSLGEVYDVRMRRAYRYNDTDVARIREQTGVPFGSSAEDLIHINNVLRLAGTVIRLGLERITMPRSDKQIVFPQEGLYVIRCIAVPIVSGNAEVVHAPSVAYQPVLARNPDVMATNYVQDTARTQFQARVRLAEIQNLLNGPFAPPNREELVQESAQLEAMLLEPGALLESRKRDQEANIARIRRRIDIRRQIEALSSGLESEVQRQQLTALRNTLRELGGHETSTYFDERLISQLERQLDQIDETLENRANREDEHRNGLRETLLSTFVSDLGNSLELSLELYDNGVEDGQRSVFISDLTTPSSGVGRATVTHRSPGSEAAKVQAVRQALIDCLENSSDYGRGRVAFRVGGQIHTQRIEAGTGRLFSEAIENATTVMSIAAILAAPFTAGQSLILLLPLGAFGAAPAAYRIYTRVDAGTIRWLSLDTAMDVVNVVGGFIGLAHAATPLRMVQMGRILMIAGIGSDGAGMLLMGAGIVQQLAALEGYTEGERAARMLEILGMAFVQIGVQAGGAIAHARYGSHPSAHGSSAETGQPGFHLDPDAAQRPTMPPSQPQQTMSGSGHSSGGGSGSSTALPGSRPVTEHARPLLDLLDQGIDRSQAPPAQPSTQAQPVPTGNYGYATRNPQRAYRRYTEALNAAAGREAAVYFNTHTQEYQVRVGSEGGVSGPYGQGWIAVVHYHPNPANVATYRLPAPADFQSLIRRYVIEGGPVREFVEFDLPGLGRGRTEFGIDPAHLTEPFYVTINLPDGSSRTLRFANDGSYHAYWGERTTYVEPGSPAYRDMINDISDYFRNREQSGQLDTPSSTPPTRSPGSQTTAGVTPPGGSPSFRTIQGELTQQGIDLIRTRFRTTEGRLLSNLTDAEIQTRFLNQPSWLEAIVLGELRATWLGRSTPTDFLIAQQNGTTYQTIASRLRSAIDAGQTSHALQTDILNEGTGEFIRRMLASHDPVLETAYNTCENHSNPRIRRRWQEFKYSQGAGDMNGFFLGKVGNKRPDAVEVRLSLNEIHLFDASFAYQDPIHNFKSAFYRVVMEQLINVNTVTATDYRSPSQQTRIGS